MALCHKQITYQNNHSYHIIKINLNVFSSGPEKRSSQEKKSQILRKMLPENHWLLWDHDLFLMPGMGTLALQGLQGGTKGKLLYM